MKSQAEYWVSSAKHDLEVAETLFKSQKYDWCLYIGHLVLEKTLKACYAEFIGDMPPRIHDLVRLAVLAGIELDDATLEFLDSVNTFNISIRYPDYQFKFYEMCTYEFTNDNFSRMKGVYQWLLKKMNI